MIGRRGWEAHRDLAVTAAAAVLLAVAAAAIPWRAVSMIVLAPLAFGLTGYAIAAACFTTRRLGGPQLAVISLGLSLAVLALGGILLNYVGGLRPLLWAALLAVVAVLGCGIAVRRRGEKWVSQPLPRPRPPGRATTAVAVLGLLFAGAGVGLAFVPLSADHAVGYSELWMRPWADAEESGLRVGVGSQEKETTSYLLRIEFGDGGAVTERELELEPGASEIVELGLDVEPPQGRSRFVSATLSLAESPEDPYRTVFGWVPPPTGSAP